MLLVECCRIYPLGDFHPGIECRPGEVDEVIEVRTEVNLEDDASAVLRRPQQPLLTREPPAWQASIKDTPRPPNRPVRPRVP